MSNVVAIALAVRILIAVCTRTFFQPDEYFQSLEPAHHIVFGYGHLTWEWLAARPIRSIAYPALNVPVYWTLKVLDLDRVDWLLILGPKVLHGALAAATDIWTCELTQRVLGQRYASTALFLSLTSFFNALSLSRSLSNSLETSLSTIAFAYYPWDATFKSSPALIYSRSRLRKVLTFSAFACIVRPTSGVIWVFLIFNLLWALRQHRHILLTVFSDILLIGFLAITLMFFLDALYYGRLVFTPLNFLSTNLSSVSLFYGSSPWHYYLLQGIPIICATSLPFVLHALWLTAFETPSRNVALNTIVKTIAWTLSIYSMAGHKEWRFIHPILPLLHVLAAKSLVDLSESDTKTQSRPKSRPIAVKRRPPPPSPPSPRWIRPLRNRYAAFILLTLPASAYVILFYCGAPISVMSYIRNLPPEELQGGAIGFLMPCHSTPGHAYLHRESLARGGMWALGCEPPMAGQDVATYKDQTDIFFDSPKTYLQTYFPSRVNSSFPLSPNPVSAPGVLLSPVIPKDTSLYPWVQEWPRYLVMFGSLLEEDGVRELLEERGYQEVRREGRAWEGEGRRKGGVRVWKWVG